MKPDKTPALTLILCSRNDHYMGNSVWRLQTTINYAAKIVHDMNKEEAVEILVADWGSNIPLREVVELNPEAAEIVSFFLIPPEIALRLQKDSPYPEVLALNAAARRASGEFIGRIDQDTLVGKRFFDYFFRLYEDNEKIEVPINLAMLFSNQRKVPYRFVVRRPSFWAVSKYIEWFGPGLEKNLTSKKPFYDHNVGIWLLHRDLWKESGGYDERMIHMNAMEYNMAARLLNKFKILNLGQPVNYDFYHLEHRHWSVYQKEIINRKTNAKHQFADYNVLNPNGTEWGLAQYNFEILPYLCRLPKTGNEALFRSIIEWVEFVYTIAASRWLTVVDSIIIRLPFIEHFLGVWAWRTQVLRETVHHQPIFSWPKLILQRWMQKKKRQ